MLSTTKVSEHIPSGFSISIISQFKGIKNKHDAYRGKDCMKNFHETFREHPMKIINFKEKKIKLLTNEQQEPHEMLKYAMFVKKSLKINMLKIKVYHKFRDHCHYTGEYRVAAHSICNLNYSLPIEIPIIFHNRSSDDYHFIPKGLAEEFEVQFTCLRKYRKIHNLSSSNRRNS